MAINTVPDLIALLNNVDIDATVLSSIVNDAPDATGSGLSPGFVTTRLGQEVKNVQKAIDDISATFSAEIQLVIDADTSIVRTTGDQVIAGVKTFTGIVKAQALEFPAGASGTVRTFDTTSLALGANNQDRLVVKGTDGFTRLVGLGTDNVVFQVGDNLMSSGSAAIEVGRERTASGNSYIDLIGDTTYSDFGSRFSREPGASGRTVIAHRGAGQFTFEALDTGAILFRTNGTTAMSVANDQTVQFNGNVFVQNNSTLIRITDTSGITDDTSDIMQTNSELQFAVDDANVTANSAIQFKVDGVEKVKINSTGIIAPKQVQTKTVTSYGLLFADQNARILMETAATNTVTIPTNAAQAFPIGTEIRLIQTSTGQTTVQAAVGVTLNGVLAGAGSSTAVGDYIDLLKIGTDTWWATGDIGTVV